ncbi:MAG: indolepyruvate oxidoreductase [Desulfarculus sp.]|nr:MAG: indolepyruvate oxidoreductase [Desulfarculus sp.]
MNARDWQAVVAGVGGQGVLFVTRVLAAAARAQGRRVLISEVHGMAQRGGAVVSHLKVGRFQGPLVAAGRADLLLALDPGEAVRNLSFLAPGAALVVNAPDLGFLSPQARRALARHKVRAICADASGLAAGAGAAKGANLVLLGAAAAAQALPWGAEALQRALGQDLPPQHKRLNQELFSLGRAAPR